MYYKGKMIFYPPQSTTTLKKNNLKNKDDLKNEDDLKMKDDLRKEDT